MHRRGNALLTTKILDCRLAGLQNVIIDDHETAGRDFSVERIERVETALRGDGRGQAGAMVGLVAAAETEGEVEGQRIVGRRFQFRGVDGDLQQSARGGEFGQGRLGGCLQPRGSPR